MEFANSASTSPGKDRMGGKYWGGGFQKRLVGKTQTPEPACLGLYPGAGGPPPRSCACVCSICLVSRAGMTVAASRMKWVTECEGQSDRRKKFWRSVARPGDYSSCIVRFDTSHASFDTLLLPLSTCALLACSLPDVCQPVPAPGTCAFYLEGSVHPSSSEVDSSRKAPSPSSLTITLFCFIFFITVIKTLFIWWYTRFFCSLLNSRGLGQGSI